MNSQQKFSKGVESYLTPVALKMYKELCKVLDKDLALEIVETTLGESDTYELE